MAKRIVIVGGVAAGASAAAKARRTSEDIEIVLLEGGPYISFANCGLPYWLGGEIAQRDALLEMTAESFARRFHVDVRVNTAATATDRQKRTVAVQASDGRQEQIGYDRLILATGAEAIRPPIQGLDRDDVFHLRTIPDVEAINLCIDRKTAAAPGQPVRALVVGGGYIGIEAAEQLARRGLKVTLVEMADQLMLGLDREMAFPLQEALTKAGCEVLTGQAVSEIIARDQGAIAITAAGREVPFDLAIVATGVRPNVALARAAGLSLGTTGAIKVDRFQRTSDAVVYAAGDNSQVPHAVLGRHAYIPLAGAANKAGRVAGANAALDLMGASDEDDRRIHLAGVLGTAIVRAGEMTAAVAGLTETAARAEELPVAVTYMVGMHHAGYYPGARRLVVKLVYSPDDGRLLGAQVVGPVGVDKRIDVLATAIQAGLAVEDLEQLDLSYAPPFGTAKDVVVLAGFAASNTRRGQMPAITPVELLEELTGPSPPAVLDVRSAAEYAAGHLDGAIHIPVDELRARINEVPSDRPVVVHCGAGYRSYLAQRILTNRGFSNVRNILGGFGLIQQVRKALGKG
ncbi:MAG: FAD-dependent oxidoreductase [Phycisphaerae bacterium]|nr:FAD-dependent oxidoreductase [Phycisphaerae bacterium]